MWSLFGDSAIAGERVPGERIRKGQDAVPT